METDLRTYSLDCVVLFRGDGRSPMDHYYVLNQYPDGVYEQNDDKFERRDGWDDWKSYITDVERSTCSFMALYVDRASLLDSAPSKGMLTIL